MTLAWKSPFMAGKKLVLLALCDNANDQGECFPSVSMLAEKCSMSERSVFNHIADLEKDGALQRNNRTGRSTIYRIDPCKFCIPADSAPLQRLHTTPATVSPPPLQILHPTPATVAPITISNHQIEPSSNRKKKELLAQLPASLVADFLEIRKAKKLPLTQTAVDGLQREADKACISLEEAVRACCEFGWGGFNAGWFAERQGKAAKQAPEPAWRTEQRNRTLAAVPAIADVSVSPTEFFDVEARNVAAITLG